MIKRLEIKNCLGIKELEVQAGKINKIIGRNEGGKTSLLEIIEKAFRNTSRRAEFVKKGEDEAWLFVEMEDGLQIERKEKPDGKSSVKLTKDGATIPKPETFLKTLSGEFSFNPVDFFEKKDKEQTEILLSLIPISITPDQLQGWFGEVPPVNLKQHAIHVLEYLAEKYFYDKRTIANSEVKDTAGEINAIFQQLPDNYNGDKWRNVVIGDLWKVVEENKNINHMRSEATKIVESKDESLRNVKNSFDLKRGEAEAYCVFRTNKVQEGIDADKETIKQKIQQERDLAVTDKKAFTDQIAHIEEQIRQLEKKKEALQNSRADVDKEMENNIRALEKDLSLVDQAADVKIESLDREMRTTIGSIDTQETESLSKIENRIKNAQKYLDENAAVDIEPLKTKAEKAESMKGYIQLFDNMKRLQGSLKDKKDNALHLNDCVNLARSLPAELLQTVKMPVKGLGINDKMQLTIDDLPISNLSTFQSIKLAWQIARATAGPLKFICIDRFESLDPINQEVAFKEMEQDEFQYFVTTTQIPQNEDGTYSTELKIETQGSLF